MHGRIAKIFPEEGKGGDKTFNKEIIIFEKTQETQIQHQTQYQQCFSFIFLFQGSGMNFHGKYVIHQRTDEYQRQKTPVPETVKHITGRQQK
jgi:hypothetical protein